MALQVVFSNNLDPSGVNLSSRFSDAVGFYISAPLISAELEIDVFLQVYFPAVIGEQVRNIPLGRIEEQAVLLNVTDTETANIIPSEFSDTGLEMALLFLASNTTFIQAAIVTKDCSLTQVCEEVADLRGEVTALQDSLTQSQSTLDLILAALNIVINPLPPSLLQQAFFFLQ